MYHVSAQGDDEHMINGHYYYYFYADDNNHDKNLLKASYGKFTLKDSITV